ncbi:MAG: hypothetical protein KA408_09985 [Flavobacteriales bacterium]|jgi:hypothetical protein|nr:hypothetical protein [Flavobacteriales bacterium]
MKVPNVEPAKGSDEFFIEERKQRTITHRKALKESMLLRSLFLEVSIFVEGLTAQLLSFLIDVKDKDQTKIFGSGSKSFSFNTKLELLIELGALTKDDRKLFELFGGIRNQFAHNWQANTAVETMSFLTDMHPTFWKSRCPTWKDEIELDYVKALQEIAHEVEIKAFKIIAIVEEKQKKEINEGMNEFTYRNMLESIPKVSSVVRDGIKDKIKRGDSWTGGDIFSIVMEFENLLLQNLNEKLRGSNPEGFISGDEDSIP